MNRFQTIPTLLTSEIRMKVTNTNQIPIPLPTLHGQIREAEQRNKLGNSVKIRSRTPSELRTARRF